MNFEEVTLYLTEQVIEVAERTSLAEAINVTDIVNRSVLMYAALSAASRDQIVSLVDIDDGVWRKVKVLE